MCTHCLPRGDRPDADRASLAVSRRSIFPSRLRGFWASSFWSKLPPPSPVANHRKPSGPNASVPPLWFVKLPGWSMVRTTTALAGFATSGSALTV